MKKLLAMLLAALMLVCVGAAALADASITFQMGGEPECMGSDDQRLFLWLLCAAKPVPRPV